MSEEKTKQPLTQEAFSDLVTLQCEAAIEGGLPAIYAGEVFLVHAASIAVGLGLDEKEFLDYAREYYRHAKTEPVQEPAAPAAEPIKVLH
jgi:hypothetical protein